MSMEKSFANLLRHSKLATFDRRLSQVYSSPKQCKQRGDWGFKRNLPTVIRTPFVTVGQLDTIEHQTPWESGHSQVAFIQRWKENFSNVASSSSSRHTTYRPPHKPQMQQQHDNYHNLASLSRAQFDHFINHAITPDTARAFHQALQSHQMTRDQVYDYLQVTFRPEPNIVMGPIYSSNSNSSNKHPGEEVVVQGRILNPQHGGYAVGIGGVIAFLPKRHAVGIKKPGDRLVVRSFYVRRAYIDDQGKPQVTVSLHPRPSPATTHLSDMVSSPTTALPSSTPSHKWSRLDPLFATTPANTMIDFQRFLSDKQHLDLTNRSLPSPATSPSKKIRKEQTSELINQIVTLLKDKPDSNKN